ncbi:hypothetical protein SAMN05216390_105103 [Lachnospiraceae bacterium KH1T2]|nr:hypothetical protein SAMN05216390_105103 [Lachnospiraceae bacterium KH1T2]
MSNEFKFDPMTGEPIKDDSKPEAGNKFDPMTGEPVSNEAQADGNVQFDPMTGEPVSNGAQADGNVQFDPMTGEPVSNGAQTDGNVQFDPMTGEPVSNGTQADGNVQFDPITGEPVFNSNKYSAIPEENPKKSNTAAIVVLIVILAAAIAGGVFAAFKLGVFKKPYEKIYDGFQKTFTANSFHITKDLSDMMDIVKSGDYNLDVDGDVEAAGYKFKGNMKYALNAKDKQQSLTASVGMGDLEFSAAEYLTDKEVLLDLGALYSRVIKYEFSDDNKGYAVKEINKDQLKAINSFPTQFFNMASCSKSNSDKVKKIVKESMSEWDIEKADPEEFEIAGKERKLSGYTVTLTGDELADLYKNIIDDAEKSNKEYYDAMKNFFGVGNFEQGKESMIEQLKEFPKTEFDIYLYNGSAAVISFEEEGEKYTMNFFKGKKALEDMEFVCGKDSIEVVTSDEDSVENIDVKGDFDGKSVKGGLEYDYKNGKIKVSAMGISYKFNLKKEKGKYTFSTDDAKYGDNSYSLSVSIYKGAKIEKIEDKNALDIGNASEEEIGELAEDLRNAYSGLFSNALLGGSSYGSDDSDDSYGSDDYGYGSDDYGYGSDDYGYGSDDYGYGSDDYGYDSDDYGYGSDDYGYGSDDYGTDTEKTSGIIDSNGNTFEY